jgi:uncharacterized membrane protein YeaQ/YmgE (transglycosylase-associated protein family)
MLGHEGVNGLNLHSLWVATIGAIVFLLLYHAIRPRRRFWQRRRLY